jgi:hypothetical protein
VLVAKAMVTLMVVNKDKLVQKGWRYPFRIQFYWEVSVGFFIPKVIPLGNINFIKSDNYG